MNIPDDATAARYEKSYAEDASSSSGACIAPASRWWRARTPRPGFTLQRELELYVQAGLTPVQVLQIATWNGCEVLEGARRARLDRAGQVADLVLVDGDPTRDISTIRKVAMVLKGDKVYYPSEVYTELGVQPFAEPVRFTEPAATK